jgi:23S rRNA (uracil1939-C5)-methyltransferase
MPACPHFPPCPGCPLLALPAAAILKKKQELVAAAFSLFPVLRGAAIRDCVAAPVTTGYRTRVKFAVGRPQQDRVPIGLFLPEQHKVFDLPRCRVLVPALLPIVASLRRLIPDAGVPVAHIDLRWSVYQQRAHVTLVMPPGSAAGGLSRLAAALQQARPEVAGVSVRRAAAGPVLRALSGRTELLAGEQYLIEKIGQRLFRLSPGSFFQASPAGALLLQSLVHGWCSPLQPARHLVDLFAGVGMLSVMLAGIARRTTAVESVAEAAADALASARLSGVSLEARASSAESVCRLLPQLQPDIIVLDPPRRGADLSVLEAVCAAGPERIAYVSCDPETLARDLAALLSGGYRLREAAPVDLFPLTDHVETVALLEKAPAPWQPRILYRDARYLVAEKPVLNAGCSAARAPADSIGNDRASAPAKLLQRAYEPVAGASGIIVLRAAGDLPAVQLDYLALVKGIPHRQGNLPRSRRSARGKKMPGPNRYRLLTVIGGYALVRIRTDSTGHEELLRQLHLIGHPVLGAQRSGERRTNRFLAETCALHRPFLHLHRVTFPEAGTTTTTACCPLPGDLRLVIRRLQRIRRHPEMIPGAEG